MKVKNLRTGVVSEFPAKVGQWLVSLGKCVEVVDKPVGSAEVVDKPPKKSTYKRKDLKAED